MTITVIGVHPMNADEERFRKFFCEYLNLAETSGPLADYDEQLYNNAYNAALIEMVVHDESFDIGKIVQPNPNQPESLWQVAWNETYLSDDGCAVIAGYPRPAKPEQRDLRLAFYIHHFWEHPTLAHASETLDLPPATVLPVRLWRLAPYELP